MTDQPKLEFFFDCSSPWTYFAFSRLLPMVERLQLPVIWRPILVGGVFNTVNQQVYSQREAMFSDPTNSRKLDYYLKDLNDWARLCGVQASMPPGHPISSVKAMRGAFYALEHDLIVPYSRAVFETYWGGGDNPDISDPAVLATICRHVGLNETDFATAIADQRYKDLLRQSTEEVIARGGFGSPTIFINDDDMYFGNDRLALVEHRLLGLLGGP
jgi:2-hydroxychromene-2-carboxylate isomerase